MVVALERKGKRVSQVYGKVIETASRKILESFMQEHICTKAAVRTDGWKGYLGLEKEFFKLSRQESDKKGEDFPQLNRVIMMFKHGSGVYIIH